MGTPRDVVNRHFETWAAHDLDAHMSLYSDDAILRGPGGPGGMEVSGREAIREVKANLMRAWPDERIDILRQFVDGDTVITEYRSTATHRGELTLATGEHVKATKQPVIQTCLCIDRVSGDRIVDTTWYYDRLDFLRQIGRIPDDALMSRR